MGTDSAISLMKLLQLPMYSDQKSTLVAMNHRRSSGQNRLGLRQPGASGSAVRSPPSPGRSRGSRRGPAGRSVESDQFFADGGVATSIFIAQSLALDVPCLFCCLVGRSIARRHPARDVVEPCPSQTANQASSGLDWCFADRGDDPMISRYADHQASQGAGAQTRSTPS